MFQTKIDLVENQGQTVRRVNRGTDKVLIEGSQHGMLGGAPGILRSVNI